MNTKRLLQASLLSMLLLGSCSSPEPGITDKVEHQIEAEDYSVSRADIQTVLSQLTRSNSSCRKMRAKTASKQYTISTIIDQTGQPVIYVVNYAGNAGFVLLSATKKYIPVLAYSQNGNYSITGDLPDGVQQWQSATVSAISANSILPNDSTNNFKDLWDGYIGVDTTVAQPEYHEQTETFNVDETFSDKQSEFQQAGYIIHRFSEESITGNAEIDEKLRGEAEYNTYPDYDWHKYAVVLEWTEATDESIENFVGSTWGIGSTLIEAKYNTDYNRCCPVINERNAVAGCLPVAIGQIMRYYKHPSDICNWDDLELTSPTLATAQFLRYIGDTIKATYGLKYTEASLNRGLDYLKKYYNVQTLNYSFDVAFEHIKKGEPVMLYANTVNVKNEAGSHVFLATGGSRRTSVTHYRLVTFYGKYTYGGIYSYEDLNRQHEGRIYLNWGWSGAYNGWFNYDNLVPATQYNSVYDVECNYISKK